MNLFQARDVHHRSKHHHGRDFLRSVSMLPHGTYDQTSQSRPTQFSRLLSEDISVRQYPHEYLSHQPLTREEIMHAIERFHIDSDDADDEEDEPTPTVDRPAPKFP